ncbi:MAG: hypothetical protein WD767_15180 [Alphaproteobacteria bacterium]
MWFWLLMLLLLAVILAWPTWPYTYERGVYRRGGYWRYGPSAAAAATAALILILFWLGLLVIAWPWAATPVAVG